MSREEELLTALLNGQTLENFTPLSRFEHYLKCAINNIGLEDCPKPISRADILLYELAEKVISGGGGGSSSTAIIVKFFNEGELHNEEAVVTGNEIPLPESPTKESTAQYVYTFLGWSLDGTNVVEVATAGTENLTYYSVWQESVAEYTVRFLNTDNTVLQESQVAYGETPVYSGAKPIDPSENSWDFYGWEPNIDTVTGDIDYFAEYQLGVLEFSAVRSGGVIVEYEIGGIGSVVDTDLVFPETYEGKPVKGILANAFQNNSNITSIVIPDSYNSLSTNSFSGCTALTIATLGNKIKSIALSTFNGSGLTKVKFGNAVSSIYQYAFYSCPLEVIDFSDATKVPTLVNANAFSGFSDNCKVVVPDALYDEWTTADIWSDYAMTFVKASEYTEV